MVLFKSVTTWFCYEKQLVVSLAWPIPEQFNCEQLLLIGAGHISAKVRDIAMLI